MMPTGKGPSSARAEDGPRPVSYTHLDVYKRQVTHLFETVEEGLIWTQIVQKMAEICLLYTSRCV